MSVIKSYQINLDISKDIKNNHFSFNQNDTNTAKITVNLTNNKIPVSLTGSTVRFAFLKADGKRVYQNATIVNPTGGIVEVMLNSQVLAVPKRVKAEVELYFDGTQQSAVTRPFEFTVERSILSTEAIQSSSDFPIIQELKNKLEKVNDVNLDTLVSVDSLSKRNKNIISLMEYENLKVSVSGGYDWSPVFNKAINEAAKVYGIVVAPLGNFDFYNPISFPPTTSFCGAGESPTGTVLNYKGNTGVWAIKTSGTHQRNKLSGFRLELNGKANGILLGDFYANLPDNSIPLDFDLNTISVSGIGSSYTGITTVNASHYTFHKVRTGYGNSTGRGVWITADGYNSGVAIFTDCTFGRVDATAIGLEVSGTVNMDTFEFNGGCYYGGKTPIKLGSNNGNFVRNIRLYGHAEARNVGQTVNVVELCNVLGGEMTLTYSGFSEPNVNAVSFKGSVERFNILSGEANAIKGTIFKDDGATLIEDCLLQPPRLTNGSDSAVIFSAGFSDKNFKFSTRRFITENINTKYLYNIDGINRISWGTQNPMLESTFQGNRGDYRHNTLPTELGATGSKYVVNGWKCISSGTGTNAKWVEDRGLTGN
ncbi:tail protein [Bacillus phage Stahl]|uniref:Tail protein n=1 Tax=Bacillus phage Stahl TaxID=1610832 RepID=A0A0E3GMN6_9CAUD|nr:minor tail protein [Bacillus phage Stahl]AKA61474.1 tail protein [Bacillus phage Stahl]